MTPVGHAAFSYAVGRGAVRLATLSVAGLVVGGLLPDVDFVVFWAPRFNEWHRVVTHNLAFCLAVAMVAATGAGWMRGRRAALVLGASVGLGALGHLLVDSMMDTSASNGIGVAWLWPFREEVSSPYNLMDLLPVPRNPAGWNDLPAAASAVLAGLVWELPWWLLAAGLWLRSRRVEVLGSTTGAEPR